MVLWTLKGTSGGYLNVSEVDSVSSLVTTVALIGLMISVVAKSDVIIVDNLTLTDIQHVGESNLVSRVVSGEVGQIPLTSPMWLHFGMIQVQYDTADLQKCHVSQSKGHAAQFEARKDKRLRCLGSWLGARHWYQFRYYIEPLQQVDST